MCVLLDCSPSIKNLKKPCLCLMGVSFLTNREIQFTTRLKDMVVEEYSQALRNKTFGIRKGQWERVDRSSLELKDILDGLGVEYKVNKTKREVTITSYDLSAPSVVEKMGPVSYNKKNIITDISYEATVKPSSLLENDKGLFELIKTVSTNDAVCDFVDKQVNKIPYIKSVKGIGVVVENDCISLFFNNQSVGDIYFKREGLSNASDEKHRSAMLAIISARVIKKYLNVYELSRLYFTDDDFIDERSYYGVTFDNVEYRNPDDNLVDW